MNDSRNNKLLKMSFEGVYKCLIEKVERKGKSEKDVDEVTSWMTGYKISEIKKFRKTDLTYGEFFVNAPKPNQLREVVNGKICGVNIDDIQNDIVKEIRRLDKLVDDIAKGKSSKEVIEKYEKKYTKLLENLNSNINIKDKSIKTQKVNTKSQTSIKNTTKYIEPFISPSRSDKDNNKIAKINLEILEDNLTAGDIILLWRINFGTFTNKSHFPKYFEYTYGIKARVNLQNLIKEGFVEEETAINSLDHINAGQKKEILKSKSIKNLPKMKSSELNEAIKDNFTDEELGKHFAIRGYKLTKKGEKALNKNQAVVDRHPKKNI